MCASNTLGNFLRHILDTKKIWIDGLRLVYVPLYTLRVKRVKPIKGVKLAHYTRNKLIFELKKLFAT